MFKVVKELTVAWPIVVQVPIDGGGVEEQVFGGHLKIIDQDEITRLVTTSQKGDQALAEAVLDGWDDDLMDANGDPLEFSEENRATLVRIPYVRVAICKAFFEAAAGIASKNSSAPASTGPAV